MTGIPQSLLSAVITGGVMSAFVVTNKSTTCLEAQAFSRMIRAALTPIESPIAQMEMSIVFPGGIVIGNVELSLTDTDPASSILMRSIT